MNILKSDRLAVGNLYKHDISANYLETLNDSEYMKYSRNSAFTHTFSSQIKYIYDFGLSHNLLLSIKKNDTGELLGSINCYIDFLKMSLDLGFLIFKNHAGKGYTTEALELLIPYLASQFPGMTLIIGASKQNFAMHQVAKKLDFQIESNGPKDINPNLRFVRKMPKLDSLSPPTIPNFILSAKRIGVAAFDAGGAEQISWLLRNLPQKIVSYIDGPAKQIFGNAQITFARVDKLSDIMECDLVITGSGWMSQLEVNAIREARLRNIPCITLLDHWVNYLERFGEDENSQPQILAVTNSIALQMAQEKFPNRVVWLLPDFQIDNYQLALTPANASLNSALVLLEPMSSSNSMFAINDKVIANIIESAISIKRIRELKRVVLRLHPSQSDHSALQSKLKQYPGEVEVSNNASLAEDLRTSAVVLGLSSYALYVASRCGKETYSCFAGSSGHWTNYFPKILTLEF